MKEPIKYGIINQNKGSDALNIESIKTNKLIPYVSNPVIHNDEQVKKLSGMIKEYGFLQPIVIDSKNVIIAGHGRYEASKLLNMDEVPSIRVDNLTDAQIKAFRILDNKIAEEREWNTDILRLELEHLSELDVSLEDYKFIEIEEEDLRELKKEKRDREKEADEYIPEEVKNLVIKKGDLIELGKHRIL